MRTTWKLFRNKTKPLTFLLALTFLLLSHRMRIRKYLRRVREVVFLLSPILSHIMRIRKYLIRGVVFLFSPVLSYIMRSRKYYQNEMLIVMVSTIVTLFIVDIFIFRFFEIPAFGDFPSPLMIDGNRAKAAGYIAKSDYLPISLKPNFTGLLANRGSQPIPKTITLDKYGYRNKHTLSNYDEVIVGDSVAFGYGLDDSETLHAILNKTKRTYSLAIEGVGPASYIRMIEEFLKRSDTKKFTILYYNCNDGRNLENSSWPGLLKCLPPTSGRIHRADVPENYSDPPKWVFSPLLRNWSLVYLANNFYQYLTSSPVDDVQIFRDASKTSKTVIEEFYNHQNYDRLATRTANIIFQLLDEMEEHECSLPFREKEIKKLREELRKKSYAKVLDMGTNLSKAMIKSSCFPVSKGGNGVDALVPKFLGNTYMLGEHLPLIKDGYVGNLYLYKKILSEVERRLGDDVKEIIVSIRKNLHTRGDLDTLTKDHQTLFEKFEAREPYWAERRYRDRGDNSCSPIDIFFDYLQSLKVRGYEVTFVHIMCERGLVKKNLTSGLELCQKAESRGIENIDLMPKLFDYYQQVGGGNALFLDSSHLNVEGTRIVSKWIWQ